MVAVRMVSEGVDVPRLSVGVYATNASTPLFFAQAIGRFVRARKRGETATVFIGPEGDFSPGEIAFALANGFEEITLGRQRLRPETAALAAVVMASVVNG